MLKLFYSPGACSLVTHISLHEAEAEHEAVRIDFAAGEQRSPDYLAVNPHGRVPALVADEGTITENLAILGYLADRFGAPGSVPPAHPRSAPLRSGWAARPRAADCFAGWAGGGASSASTAAERITLPL